MQKQSNHKFVLWIIWIAILNGCFVIGFVLGGEPFQGDSEINIPVYALILISAAISIGIRLLLIPKVKTYQQLMPLFIVGIALADSITILGTVISPSFWPVFAFFSVVVMLCYIPAFLPQVEAA